MLVCTYENLLLSNIFFAQVHWELTSKRVLTAEWIDGCRATDKEAILNMGLNLADVSS